MLKILDKMMNSENDKWLEQQLSATPDVEDNQFTRQVMEKISAHNQKIKRTRTFVLITTYFISFLLIALITPWAWIASRFDRLETNLTGLFSSGAESQVSMLGIGVMFIVSFFLFVFTQESN